MEKISAVVIDDEINSVKLLIRFIKKYCPEVEVIGEAYTKKDAISLINTKQPNILFLDVRLDVGLSFDLLNELTYKNAKIIFVTAYDEYAVKAFKYNAIDYILKPINIDELVVAVENAIEDIKKDIYTSDEQLNRTHDSILDTKYEFNFIAIPTIKRIDFVSIKDIIYLKSDGRYTFLHLINDKNIIATRNLGEYESTLNPSVFFRIHKSYLANLNFVTSIFKGDGFYCEMKNGEQIPVARRRVEFLLDLVNSK
ncbi:LytTR family DNA-binding domain-containing protein [uncultured Tenacibaculum sp.]|uniref:LytR/AlgR family response regulator transcription factor n=1 Tax=uncultured Tenacibaculum sp. TaxID=174713 RepID=UPI00260EF33E|nr:LytTR family DNA-binding domain-containing protein [uncultured Tenacibaculum sp.]